MWGNTHSLVTYCKRSLKPPKRRSNEVAFRNQTDNLAWKDTSLCLKLSLRLYYNFSPQAGNVYNHSTTSEAHVGCCRQSLAALDPAFNPDQERKASWNFQTANSLEDTRLTDDWRMLWSLQRRWDPTTSYQTSSLAPPTLTTPLFSSNLSHQLMHQPDLASFENLL